MGSSPSTVTSSRVAAALSCTASNTRAYGSGSAPSSRAAIVAHT